MTAASTESTGPALLERKSESALSVVVLDAPGALCLLPPEAEGALANEGSFGAAGIGGTLMCLFFGGGADETRRSPPNPCLEFSLTQKP